MCGGREPQELAKLEIESKDNRYSIGEYITKIIPETTKESFLENIKVTEGATKELLNQDGNPVEEGTKIATGMKIRAELNGETKEYELVVIGDLDGNGEVDNIDLLKLARYKVGLDKNLEGVYLEATDVNQNTEKADDKDLLKLARILVNLDNF